MLRAPLNCLGALILPAERPLTALNRSFGYNSVGTTAYDPKRNLLLIDRQVSVYLPIDFIRLTWHTIHNKLAVCADCPSRAGGDNMRAIDIVLAGAFMCLGANLFANNNGIESADRGPQSAGKTQITSLDDLPRKVYPIDTPASELIVSDEFATLAAQVEADVRKILEDYDIQDEATLQKLYRILSQTAFFNGDYDSAIHWMEKRRALEDKASNRLTMGLVMEAWVAARNAVGQESDEEVFRAKFRENLAASVAGLPWAIVQDDIEQVKGQAEILSNNLILGVVQSQIDPIIAKSGELTEAAAWELILWHGTMDLFIPVKDEISAVYSELIAANRVVKPDIWAERSVSLDSASGASPVVIGIWDSGVDTSVFQGSLWTNINERIDGTDSDGNGFVDDVHGVAFDVEGSRTPELLQPAGDMTGQVDEAMSFIKGLTDIMSSIDSDEASEMKRHMSELQPAEVEQFLTSVNFASSYAHGTHVAGIAIEGNPFARILISRYTFDYHQPRRLLTTVIAQRYAQSHYDAVEYFKRAGVRAVNMSWTWTLKEVEGILESNGITDPEERKARTNEIFGILRDSLYEAIDSAPDILFFVAAGNSDSDVEFDEMIPSSFDLPNIVAVAAVDQAGDPTHFTSSGRNVKLCANGFEVESFVPGGATLKLSGTSMASPNALNLAAKLLALDSTLTPGEVVELIEQGATPRDEDGGMLLIHPKQSIDQLRQRSSPTG